MGYCNLTLIILHIKVNLTSEHTSELITPYNREAMSLTPFDFTSSFETTSEETLLTKTAADEMLPVEVNELEWDWDTDHQTKIKNFLRTGYQSDVTLLVGKDKVPIAAHKIFLLGGSPELRYRLEQASVKVADVKQLIVDDVEYNPFHTFLEFLYTGEVSPGTQELDHIHLLQIANEFKVPRLSSICVATLKRCANKENVLIIYQNAIKLGDKALIKHSLEIICRNAWTIVNSEDFLNLSPTAIYEILKEDDLEVRSEIDLFQAVKKWGEAECGRQKMDETDPVNLRKVLHKVIGLIRFPLMDSSDFAMNVAMGSILDMEEIVKVLVYFTVAADKRVNIPQGRFSSTSRRYRPDLPDVCIKVDMMEESFASSDLEKDVVVEASENLEQPETNQVEFAGETNDDRATSSTTTTTITPRRKRFNKF